jgi:hypothetical protein
MPFPQDQAVWLLTNREKLLRYAFIPQLLVSLLFLGFAYATGKTHAHLLFRGARTNGKIVELVPVQMRTRTSSGSSWTETIYEPIVEFPAGDRLVRFQEWKGSSSNASLGWSVPVLYDPVDPSFAMIDRGAPNWIPWAPSWAIGLVLAFAALKGLFAFARPQDATAPARP